MERLSLDTLLSAIAASDGRVVLVTGAGCSNESPTNLPLSRKLAEDCHRHLRDNGTLPEDCPNPRDLAVLAQAVMDQHGGQAKLVESFPADDMVRALPNAGHRIAAALLAEGVLDALLTLNFDHAHENAIKEIGPRTKITLIRDAHDLDQVGHRMLVHLHGMLDHTDPEELVLRRDQLNEGWQATWRQVLAHRVLSTGHVVLAGFGDPATDVLIKTAKFIRSTAQDNDNFHVVDIAPSDKHQVLAALELDESSYHQMGWSDFMEVLGDRLLKEHTRQVEEACRSRIDANDAREENFSSVCEDLTELGLVRVGRLRAQWFQDDTRYRSFGDDAGRMADLVLLLATVLRVTGMRMEIQEDGIIELFAGNERRGGFVLASGAGERGWSQVNSKILDTARTRALAGEGKLVAILAGTATLPPAAPVVDLVDPADAGYVGIPPPPAGDLVNQRVLPLILHADHVRNDPTRLVDFFGGPHDA